MYIFQLSLIVTDWKILQDMWCMYIWPYAILKKTPQNKKQKNPNKNQNTTPNNPSKATNQDPHP